MQSVNWQSLQNGSDIRGVALAGVPNEPVNLTPEVVHLLGKAFATWLASRLGKSTADLRVSLGRDSRLSGEELLQSVADGIASVGSHGVDVAIASTPAMFMSTVTPGFNCDGAIMLTASHLPFNRNGLKFFTAQGGLSKTDISALLKLAQDHAFDAAPIRGNLTQRNFISIYADQLVQRIRQTVNHPEQYAQPLKGFKIVVDAGNGAGGFFASQVLEPLGADTTGSQFLDPDGTFPNHIPNPENPDAMASIVQAVLDNKADLGIIFDTDVDRCAAVDHLGQAINRNRLIALMSAIVLREHPGSTIVTDSITSDGLTEFIETDLKGVHHRFKRGYKNVIDEAIRLNESGQESWLAIETSGHGAMKENYFLDDGAYLVSTLLIEAARLKLEGKGLSDLIAHLKEPQESEEFRIKLKRDDFKAYGRTVIDKLQEFAESQHHWAIVPNNYEGVRVSCLAPHEAGWFLLRLSLHDPVIPLNIESNVTGGVSAIQKTLLDFFQPFDGLDLSALQENRG
ncbi:MAG: phosphomannomutase/phosphoglucomutase [Thermosynechococcaceae cyanobacterium]